MSKIFFDHLIEIEEIQLYIDKTATSHEEKEDLWNLVDEFVNHKVISSILSKLDAALHDEFLCMFLDKPYDMEIINYLNEKLPVPFESLLESRMNLIICELYETFELQPPAGKVKKVDKKKRK